MNKLNGWLLIDKPVGMSSAQVVGKVKRILNLKKRKSKIGHTGTLDPLASGVLPLAVGEATKLAGYALNERKAYQTMFKWGERRTTDDAEGEVIQASEIVPTKDDIEAVMKVFMGVYLQTPPNFSAIKVAGERSYKKARAEEDEQAHLKLNLEPRQIEIYNFKLLSEEEKQQQSEFVVDCSKGTYIRSLARDMGEKLGSHGYVAELKRIVHGKYSIHDTITLEKLEELCEKGDEQQAFLPVDDILDDIPELKLSEEDAQKLRNGIALNTTELDSETVAVFNSEKTLTAICSIKNGLLRPKRVFNL